MSWGKVDPLKLPDAVVCYGDSTVYLPLVAHYVLARRKPRKLKRLYHQRDRLLDLVRREYLKNN